MGCGGQRERQRNWQRSVRVAASYGRRRQRRRPGQPFRCSVNQLFRSSEPLSWCCGSPGRLCERGRGWPVPLPARIALPRSCTGCPAAPGQAAGAAEPPLVSPRSLLLWQASARPPLQLYPAVASHYCSCRPSLACCVGANGWTRLGLVRQGKCGGPDAKLRLGKGMGAQGN